MAEKPARKSTSWVICFTHERVVLRESARQRRGVIGTSAVEHQRRLTMLKTFLATLVLASTMLGVAGQAYAGPDKRVHAPNEETSYTDRASKNWDGGGY